MRRVILVFSLLAVALAWPPTVETGRAGSGLVPRSESTDSMACGLLRNLRQRLFRKC